jgi:hypothetical protein
MLVVMTVFVHHRVVSFTPAITQRTTAPLPTTSIITTPRLSFATSKKYLCLHSLPHEFVDFNTFSMAVVETFDGSQIVDPIVVSNVFWTSLQTKLISFVIGQVLATIVFTLLLWLIGSQISNIMTFLSDRISTVWKEQPPPPPTTLRIPIELQESTPPPADFSKLLLCMAIDVIGSSSELIPFVGEITDVVYAPVAAWLLRSIFGSNNVLFLLEFAEEILPFTDILPLATICWVVDTYYRDSDLAKVLRLGNYAAATDVNTATTTTTTIRNEEPYLLREDRNTEEMQPKK